MLSMVRSMDGVELCGTKAMAAEPTATSISSAGGYLDAAGHVKRKSILGPVNARNKMRGAGKSVKVEASRRGGGAVKRVGKDDGGDTASELDAARALTEFFRLARLPSPMNLADDRDQVVPHWSRKRRRSSRIRAVGVMGFDNPVLSQLSPCCFSGGIASKTASAAFKVEDDSGSEEQPCTDMEGQHKLLSDSSNESPQANSRAESPSSPLPTVNADKAACISVIPKLEETFSGRSAFQRVVPIRPLKKPSIFRQLKVDAKMCNVAIPQPQQATVKQVARKKPRPNCASHLVTVKTEDADSPLAVSCPIGVALEFKKDEFLTSANEAKELTKEEELESGLLKLENKITQKAGQRIGSKLKHAVSESEKEARRQRRVQANRESARQTIRRKQVLCEELTKKSQHLAAENEMMKQDIELLLLQYKKLSDTNMHLKEELGGCPGNPVSASVLLAIDGSSSQMSLTEKPSGAPPVQFPFVYSAVPRQFMWAALSSLSLAKTGHAGVQLGELVRVPDLSATASYGNIAPYWMGANGQGIPFLPSVLPKFPPSSSSTSDSHISRLPAAGPSGDASSNVILGKTDSGKALTRRNLENLNMQTEGKMFADGSYQGLSFPLQPKFVGLASPASQCGISPVPAFRTPRREEGTLFSSAGGRDMHMSGNGNLHAPRMVDSRYPSFGTLSRRYSDCTQQLPATKPSGAAAAAAEARRRRKELTRSKSLPYRLAARVIAEPPS